MRSAAAATNPSVSYDEPTYEVDSKQVRQYRVNDTATIKKAIEANMSEFLDCEGVDLDTRTETLRYAIAAVSVLVGASVYLAGLWPFRVPFATMKPYLVVSIIFYNVCAGVMYYLIRFVDTSCFFVSRPPTVAALGASPKGTKKKGKETAQQKDGSNRTAVGDDMGTLGDVLAGQRVRLSSKSEMFSPMITIRAELLDPRVGWYSPAKVLAAVDREWSFGKFFDAEGYLYPPSLKAETASLIKELVKKKTA